MLADIFENVRNMSVEIYELYPAKVLSAPKLAWKASLKKTKIKLNLLTDVIKGRKVIPHMSLYLSICKS